MFKGRAQEVCLQNQQSFYYISHHLLLAKTRGRVSLRSTPVGGQKRDQEEA